MGRWCTVTSTASNTTAPTRCARPRQSSASPEPRGTFPGMAGGLLFVTQTAPYATGPAGVHGVLGQAERALDQLASLHDLTGASIPDVRQLDDAALRDARVLALFTIGETPWNASQRATIASRVRAGELGIV